MLKKIISSIFLALALLSPLVAGFIIPSQTWAAEDVLGVHLLTPHDLDDAQKLPKESPGDKYITIPLTLNDLGQYTLWQRFFNDAKKHQMIPIVRLATQIEGQQWKKPTRWDVVRLFHFLNLLNWPTDERYVIIFNEVNHAKEWGGQISPREYTQVLDFAANWAHTELGNYQVLPAAMDLDAPNGSETIEAFNYLSQMLAYQPDIFDHIDIWNSHSYPNPGFSASPTRAGKNSLRGFQHELNFLKQRTGRDFEVMITETGWQANAYTEPWLENYYTYAMQHVWSLPEVKAVTPFVVKGAPGPFANFSFYDDQGQPTKQYQAFVQALKEVKR